MNFRPLLRHPALLATVFGFAPHLAHAEVKLPALFSDHLVLQQDTTVPVWGWAAPGEEVTVSIKGQKQSTKADAEGKWKVQLAKLSPGEPTELSVKGTNEITVHDVLVGEVWLGSGQSNMAMTVSRAQNIEEEQRAANLPDIRMFTVSSGASNEAQQDCKGSWVVCSPSTVGSFSAALYFFGRDIHQVQKVPMGLINSSVGGTPIESWIDEKTQHADTKLDGFFTVPQRPVKAVDPEVAKAQYEKKLEEWKEAVKKAKAENTPMPRRPADPATAGLRKGGVGGLFNGKIAPLIPFALRGALWYQGEANANPDKALYYQYQLPLLVKDWRARWGSEFPFAWVQLPNFSNRGDGWCLVREAMMKTLALPKTGMAITLDVGIPNNIHPTNKQAVGFRLAQWALGTVYGKGVETSGPLYTGNEIHDGQVTVNFSHTAKGLVVKGGQLKEFVIAGEDHAWHPATAEVKGDQVVVSSPEVVKPVAVRYAWKDNPEATLFNSADLPASPFRTDDWPMDPVAPAVRTARK